MGGKAGVDAGCCCVGLEIDDFGTVSPPEIGQVMDPELLYFRHWPLPRFKDSNAA